MLLPAQAMPMSRHHAEVKRVVEETRGEPAGRRQARAPLVRQDARMPLKAHRAAAARYPKSAPRPFEGAERFAV